MSWIELLFSEKRKVTKYLFFKRYVGNINYFYDSRGPTEAKLLLEMRRIMPDIEIIDAKFRWDGDGLFKLRGDKDIIDGSVYKYIKEMSMDIKNIGYSKKRSEATREYDL